MRITTGAPNLNRIFLVAAGLLIASLLLPSDNTGHMPVFYLITQSCLSAGVLALAIVMAKRRGKRIGDIATDLSVNVTLSAAAGVAVQALYFGMPLVPLLFFVGFPHTVFARQKALLWIPSSILLVAAVGRYLFTGDKGLIYWAAVLLLFSAALSVRMSRDKRRIDHLNSKMERFLSDAREVMGRIEEDSFTEVYDRIRGERAAMAVTLDEDNFLQGLLTWGCRVFNARTGILLVPDEGEPGYFRMRAAAVQPGVEVLEGLVPGDKGFIHITREREGILCVSDASSARQSLSFYPEDTLVGSFLVKIVMDPKWGMDADDGKEPGKVRCILYFDSEAVNSMSLDETTARRLDEFGNLVLKAMTTAGSLQKLTKEVSSRDAISRYARGLTLSLDTEEIARMALEAVVDAVPRCDGAVVMLYDDALSVAAFAGEFFEDLEGERILRDEASHMGLFLRRIAEIESDPDARDAQIAEIVIDRKQARRTPFFHKGEPRADIISFAAIPCYMAGTVRPLKAAIAVISREEDVFKKEELKELRTIAGMMAPALDNAITHKQVDELSRTDGLTGLLNRRYFQIVFDGKLNNLSRGYFQSMAVIMVDGDRFKNINDTYGHSVGDEVLVEIAKRLKAGVRKNGAVARYGGEEFVIVLDNAGEKQAREIAEKMRHAIRSKAFLTTAGKIQITASFGFSVMSGTEAVSNKEFLDHADQALYHAKESGRDKVVSYQDIGKSGVDFQTDTSDAGAAGGEGKIW